MVADLSEKRTALEKGAQSVAGAGEDVEMLEEWFRR